MADATTSKPETQEVLNDLPQLDLERKEIRILELLPRCLGHRIQCTLHTAYISQQPKYEALSYAWGDPNVRSPILLDDRTVQVTTNLAAALSNLRYRWRSRRLWVDALCINQDNTDEKSHQVNLMREIYSKTERGLLWVGNCEGSQDATAQDVVGCPFAPTPMSSNGEGDTQKFDTSPISTILPADAEKAFKLIRFLAAGHHHRPNVSDPNPQQRRIEAVEREALAKFMRLAWWTRIWTVQEATLPSIATVICGRHHLPWATLVQAASNVNKHHHVAQCCSRYEDDLLSTEQLSDKVETITYYKDHPPRGRHVSTLLHLFSERAAADPRDKIYALLGLVDPSVDRLARYADYALDWRVLYQRTTATLIELSGDLSPLCGRPEIGRDAHLPSWVPDWSARVGLPVGSWAMFGLEEYLLFDSSNGRGLEIRAGPEHELTILGLLADRVQVISTSSEDGGRIGRFEWRKSLQLWGLWSSRYPDSDGTYADAFWRVINRDMGRDGPGVTFVRLDRPHREERAAALDNASLLMRRHVNRTFFVTEKGYMGLSHLGTMAGDSVHVLFGSRVPFILRKVEPPKQSGGCYYFVGAAYVHGIMDGEAVSESDEGVWTTLV